MDIEGIFWAIIFPMILLIGYLAVSEVAINQALMDGWKPPVVVEKEYC